MVSRSILEHLLERRLDLEKTEKKGGDCKNATEIIVIIKLKVVDLVVVKLVVAGDFSNVVVNSNHEFSDAENSAVPLAIHAVPPPIRNNIRVHDIGHAILFAID
jgi:hypothetical protein